MRPNARIGRVFAMGFLVMILLVIFSAGPSLSACPFCKDAVGDGPAASATTTGGGTLSGAARGFANAIYLMLAMPFVLVGAGVFAVRRSIRRAQSASRPVAPSAPVPSRNPVSAAVTEF